VQSRFRELCENGKRSPAATRNTRTARPDPNPSPAIRAARWIFHAPGRIVGRATTGTPSIARGAFRSASSRGSGRKRIRQLGTPATRSNRQAVTSRNSSERTCADCALSRSGYDAGISGQIRNGCRLWRRAARSPRCPVWSHVLSSLHAGYSVVLERLNDETISHRRRQFRR